ncbi:MAG: NYN domain-containing protein [Candidatus Hydrothermia bacterium]
MKIFIIDGYNVINSIPDLEKHKELERARSELIRIIRERLGSNYIIVFDGKRGSKNLEDPKIIFTSNEQEADILIYKKAQEYAKLKVKVIVISRDKVLLNRCRQIGASSMDPMDLFNTKTINSSSKSKGAEKLNSHMQRAITKELERVFGIKDTGEKDERI